MVLVFTLSKRTRELLFPLGYNPQVNRTPFSRASNRFHISLTKRKWREIPALVTCCRFSRFGRWCTSHLLRQRLANSIGLSIALSVNSAPSRGWNPRKLFPQWKLPTRQLRRQRLANQIGLFIALPLAKPHQSWINQSLILWVSPQVSTLNGHFQMHFIVPQVPKISVKLLQCSVDLVDQNILLIL